MPIYKKFDNDYLNRLIGHAESLNISWDDEIVPTIIERYPNTRDFIEGGSNLIISVVYDRLKLSLLERLRECGLREKFVADVEETLNRGTSVNSTASSLDTVEIFYELKDNLLEEVDNDDKKLQKLKSIFYKYNPNV